MSNSTYENLMIEIDKITARIEVIDKSINDQREMLENQKTVLKEKIEKIEKRLLYRTP